MSIQATCGTCCLPITEHGDDTTDAVRLEHEVIRFYRDFFAEEQERLAEQALKNFEHSQQPNIFQRLFSRMVAK